MLVGRFGAGRLVSSMLKYETADTYGCQGWNKTLATYSGLLFQWQTSLGAGAAKYCLCLLDVYIHMYIYIYIERERVRDLSIYLSIYVYIYIYIYIYMCMYVYALYIYIYRLLLLIVRLLLVCRRSEILRTFISMSKQIWSSCGFLFQGWNKTLAIYCRCSCQWFRFSSLSQGAWAPARRGRGKQNNNTRKSTMPYGNTTALIGGIKQYKTQQENDSS